MHIEDDAPFLVGDQCLELGDRTKVEHTGTGDSSNIVSAARGDREMIATGMFFASSARGTHLCYIW